MADRFQYRPESVGSRDDRGAVRRAASQSAESDPLAELARLIGQTEQGAGFGATNRAVRTDRNYDQHQHDEQLEPVTAEPAPPSWMRTAADAGRQPPAEPVALEPQGYSADPYPQEEEHATPSFLRTMRQRDDHQHQHHQHQQQYDDQSRYDQSRYDDVLYDQNSQNAAQYQDQRYADGAYQDGYQDQQHDQNGYQPYYGEAEQEEPSRRRGGLMTVAAVLALAVIGTAGAFAYRSFVGSPRSGEPPVIKAETGATKIVPPTQTSDASGKIVDRIGAAPSGQEQLLSREEQPVDINGRNPPRVVFPPLNQNANPPSPQSVASVAAPAPQRAAPNGALGDEPKRVRTLSIRPDQPDAVPTSSQTAPSRATTARAQAPAPANAPISLSPQGSPAPTRMASAGQAVGGSGGYMVQISSQRSEADAQAAYRAMQSKFPNVLGSRSAMIRRADLGDKGIYYRAMVGPFSAAEEAGQLCNSLKSAGGQCVVQRN